MSTHDVKNRQKRGELLALKLQVLLNSPKTSLRRIVTITENGQDG